MRRLIALLPVTVGLCSLAFGVTGALAVAPVISTTAISQVTATSAILEADINPQNKVAKYHFEYGPGDCASNPCVSTLETVLAKGTATLRVKAAVKGLTPGTTYHFRALAKNLDGDASPSPDKTFMTYLPPQEFAACPNDQLRKENPAAARIEYSSAGLPDCRAYEQATPVDKGAGDTAGTAPFVRASLAGGGVTFLSVSGVPGGKGSQEFPAYLASRGTSWLTQGLLPPAGTGQQAALIGWTPDFSDFYTKATELGDPSLTTLLATSPGGEPKTIAPYTDQLSPSFAGASSGGGEVLFESRAAIAGVTGAIAGKSNLYLWREQGGALSLVDVTNDEQALPGGAFAGSYDWLRGTDATTLSEGGADRRYYTQDQHAISADGSAIYFTAAGSGQLYARLNPTQEQSDVNGGGKCTKAELACTVNISASQRGVPDPAGARPAAFMGASSDGSRALFTSSQMLTDTANTGPEQKPATIERADRNGANVAPSLAATHGTAIAVDSEHIYWVDLETSAIARAKLDGTGVEPQFITATENPKGVAVADGEIYWTNAASEVKEEDGTIKVTEGTIGRAKLNGEGNASEVEQDFIEGAGNPHAVTADAEHVFWTNEPMAQSHQGFVGRAAVDGGEVEPKLVEDAVVLKEMPGIAVDSEHIYWMDTNAPGTGDFSRISRASLDGGDYIATFIFLGEGVEGKGLAVQGNQIYWSGQVSETIARANLNGEGPASEEEAELIKGANHPQGVALDATHVYWTSNGESSPNPGNDLYQYESNAGGGTLSDLVPDSTDPAGADVRGVLGTSEDASYIYFAANGVPNGVTGSPNGRGEAAVAGECKGILSQSTSGSCNLYLAHGGEVRFITRLDTDGGEAATDAANWAATPKQIFPSPLFQKASRVSPDGQALLFRSQRQLTSYENGGSAEYYLYRAGSGALSCVTCDPSGEAPSLVGGPQLGAVTTSTVIPTPPASILSHNLSSDGNRVFFETTDALVGADTNGDQGCPRTGSLLQQFRACTDTYEWEAQGTGSCAAAQAVADGGCIYLISTGKGSEPQMIADVSGDGKEVFFYSRSRLVGQDEDQLMDIYDGQVEGGLDGQNPPPPNSCLSTETCHPNGPQPNEIPPPPKFSGPGNPKGKSQACPKGKHRIKGRCVAKKHHKKKGAKGKAKAKGRAGR